MRFSVLSLFPEFFQGPFSVSMLKRAIEKGLISIDLINIRDYALDKHKKVDDRPFGGGPGMVLKPEPVTAAIRDVKQPSSNVVYLSPQGKPLTAKLAEAFSKQEHLVLLCGHYEGVDQRALDLEVNEEVSIGDYVLTSGCPAAVVFVDAVSRFIPGVLGHADAAFDESFQQGRLEAPQYTHPETFEGHSVPEVLRSGHHQNIEAWRQKKSIEKTVQARPDLLQIEN